MRPKLLGIIAWQVWASIVSLRTGVGAIGSDDLYRLGCIEPRGAPCRYENLVQVRCLLEGYSEDDILREWHSILPECMQQWHLDRQEVRRSSPAVSLFRGARAWRPLGACDGVK